jgi:pantothenate kinase
VADAIPECTAADLASWISERAAGSDRYVFGIAGPPGSGKSTLAARLGTVLGAPVVAMDGFHLPNDVLRSRGLLAVKGAPETFDADGFLTLVRAIRDASGTVWCPAFDRTIDAPVADYVSIGPGDVVVVVEGNYLLLDRPPWVSLSGVFDAIAYLDVPGEIRRSRLIARHVEFGRDPADAAEFVQRSDEANAVLVEASRIRADLVVR